MEKALGKVIKRGNQYCVVSKDGSKEFGCYDTREGALKRLRQIEFFKSEGVLGELLTKESPDLKTYASISESDEDKAAAIERWTLDSENEE